MIITLSKKDFKKFVKYCEYWKKVLNLLNWKIYYSFSSIEHLAQVEINYSGRNATITLSTVWEMPDNTLINIEEELERTALHEILELLLSPLEYLASDRKWDAEEYRRNMHEIIRVFENILEKKY
ncbi:hypothetical protein DRN69_04265 [Candidatus Pacearchaeota archaeon]|nr:MAG: hypothetical protein DRN69_04265 [Candidatus Pacearchaeota archaeon]